MRSRPIFRDESENAQYPRVRHFLLTAVFLLIGSVWSYGQTIETSRFLVKFDSGANLVVYDKLAKVTWQQPAAQKVKISNVTTGKDRMSFSVDDKVTVTMDVHPSFLEMTLSGDSKISIEKLEYPSGFTLLDSKTQRLLVPNCGGMAFPFSMKDDPLLTRVKGYYTSNQTGLMMPWLGVTDGTVGSMMLVTTPFDAQMKIETDAKGYQTVVSWLDSKGKMAYSRGVRYYFSASGGYVTLCKLYRQYAIEQGLFVSLKEKQKSLPSLDRFIGAMSLWIVEWPDIALLEKMKAAGIDKLLVSYHTGKKPAGITLPPDVFPSYESINHDFADKLHRLGYLAGRYDYYRTIYPPSQQSGQWVMRRTGYPEQCALDGNGNIVPGFKGKKGDKEIKGHRCSICQYELAKAYIPKDVTRVGYDARLLDAVVAVSFQECYSKTHPVTRAEDAAYRLKQLAVAMDCKQITGTEHMAAWAVPAAHYSESPTTFVRYAGIDGDNRLNAAPLEVSEGFRRVVLNEQLRVPLWQLVFHDAVVISNRWDWSPNRYKDKFVWEKEDLINLLHGQMPTMMLDQANFDSNKNEFIRTYQTVCQWNTQIGYEEMINHRWLSEDGSVQQAIYESGKNVIVNFGAKNFLLSDGTSVAAGGYITQDKLLLEKIPQQTENKPSASTL